MSDLRGESITHRLALHFQTLLISQQAIPWIILAGALIGFSLGIFVGAGALASSCIDYTGAGTPTQPSGVLVRVCGVQFESEGLVLLLGVILLVLGILATFVALRLWEK